MDRYTFFHRPESNRVHPSTLPAKVYDFFLPYGTTLEDALAHAYANGLPRGSARAGCFEVQCDAGIWNSHHGGRMVPSKATFTPWED